MHKLNRAEAERVQLVLEDAVSSLHLLAHVPDHLDPDTESHLAEEKIPESISQALLHQFQLEEAYLHAIGPEKPSLLQRLRHGARSLCRELENDPHHLPILETLKAQASSPVISPQSRRSGEEDAVEALIHELKQLSAISFEHVAKTMEEEESKLKLIGEFTAREQESREEKKTLETELALLRREKERSLGTLGVQLAKLETELSDVTGHNSNEEAHVRRCMQDKLTRLYGQHMPIREELSAQVAKLKEEIAGAAVENEERELAHRKKVTKSETETNGWISTYDKEMRRKFLRKKRLQAQMEAEEKRLAELSAHFQNVDEENARIEEEEAEWKAFLAERYEKERIYDDGAAALQKLYRGAAARAHVAAMKKKKKPKGKKG